MTTASRDKIVGIMGAMPEEIEGITELLTAKEEIHLGGRIYYVGFLHHCKTVVVFSRWGKVAAAMTASTLILEFNVTEIVFTGVAGAIDPGLRIGDIVIGKRLFQHDMDARPFMKRFEIPLLGVTCFECPAEYIHKAEAAITDLLHHNHPDGASQTKTLQQYGIDAPRLYIGDIASGDKVVSSREDKQALLDILPTILCVEMEGAAVAQVCYEHHIPFIIIRAISDTSDDGIEIDFPSFIRNVISLYSREIIKLYFRQP